MVLEKQMEECSWREIIMALIFELTGGHEVMELTVMQIRPVERRYRYRDMSYGGGVAFHQGVVEPTKFPSLEWADSTLYVCMPAYKMYLVDRHGVIVTGTVRNIQMEHDAPDNAGFCNYGSAEIDAHIEAHGNLADPDIVAELQKRPFAGGRLEIRAMVIETHKGPGDERG
jgi:hypothetical protein